ncbi:MAG: transposase domain-containing protein [Pseudonocardiaceae bacterium]
MLVTAVPRDAVDAAVRARAVGDRHRGGKPPAHLVAYLTRAMCLFNEDDYQEGAAKVTGALSMWGCMGCWVVHRALAQM